jgi:hypothetical protein
MSKVILGLLSAIIQLGGVGIFHAVRIVAGFAGFARDTMLDAVYGKPVIVGATAPMVKALPPRRPEEGDFAPTVQAAPPAKAIAPARANGERDNLVLRSAEPVMGAIGGAGCDRVRTVEVSGPHKHLFGVMWFYLYPREKKAKRLFKVMDPELKRVLNDDNGRYFLPDAPYDPVTGFEPLRRATFVEVQKLLGKREVKVRDKRAEQPAVEARPQTAATPLAKPAVAQAVAVEHAVNVANANQADAAGAARKVKGDVYEGIVTVARVVTRQGATGPYQNFCLTVNAGGKEVPLYGAELQRIVQDLSLKVGENVKVVFMGKQRIDIPGQEKPAWKNLYQVNRVQP